MARKTTIVVDSNGRRESIEKYCDKCGSVEIKLLGEKSYYNNGLGTYWDEYRCLNCETMFKDAHWMDKSIIIDKESPKEKYEIEY